MKLKKILEKLLDCSIAACFFCLGVLGAGAKLRDDKYLNFFLFVGILFLTITVITGLLFWLNRIVHQRLMKSDSQYRETVLLEEEKFHRIKNKIKQKQDLLRPSFPLNASEKEKYLKWHKKDKEIWWLFVVWGFFTVSFASLGGRVSPKIGIATAVIGGLWLLKRWLHFNWGNQYFLKNELELRKKMSNFNFLPVSGIKDRYQQLIVIKWAEQNKKKLEKRLEKRREKSPLFGLRWHTVQNICNVLCIVWVLGFYFCQRYNSFDFLSMVILQVIIAVGLITFLWRIQPLMITLGVIIGLGCLVNSCLFKDYAVVFMIILVGYVAYSVRHEISRPISVEDVLTLDEIARLMNAADLYKEGYLYRLIWKRKELYYAMQKCVQQDYDDTETIVNVEMKREKIDKSAKIRQNRASKTKDK